MVPNLTPIVDIVFLLIIFFMLSFQFIVAENFQVKIPDKADMATARQKESEKLSTLTITKQGKDIVFAVGGESIVYDEKKDIQDLITTMLNRQLSSIKDLNKIVCLRIDRDITYKYTQIALASVAQSQAVNIQLNVIKNRFY
jgi:biopolymer transport protein ExbD